MITTIFLDCDGVLADFTGHALNLYDKGELLEPGVPVPYSISAMLGISSDKFWKYVDNDYFWRTIPSYHGAVEFLAELSEFCMSQDIALRHMTAGNRSTVFPQARTQWLNALNMLAGVDVPIILVSSWQDKHLLAGKDRLFIDDSDDVLDVVSGKGAAIVRVPQPWNQDVERSKKNPDYGLVMARVRMEVLDAGITKRLGVCSCDKTCGHGPCDCVSDRHTDPKHSLSRPDVAPVNCRGT